MDESLAVFVKTNGCAPNPAVESLSPVAQDGTHVERKTFSSGSRAGEVIGYTVHGWGPGSGNIDATRTIVDFCLSHARGG